MQLASWNNGARHTESTWRAPRARCQSTSCRAACRCSACCLPPRQNSQAPDAALLTGVLEDPDRKNGGAAAFADAAASMQAAWQHKWTRPAISLSS